MERPPSASAAQQLATPNKTTFQPNAPPCRPLIYRALEAHGLVITVGNFVEHGKTEWFRPVWTNGKAPCLFMTAWGYTRGPILERPQCIWQMSPKKRTALLSPAAERFSTYFSDGAFIVCRNTSGLKLQSIPLHSCWSLISYWPAWQLPVKSSSLTPSLRLVFLCSKVGVATTAEATKTARARE